MIDRSKQMLEEAMPETSGIKGLKEKSFISSCPCSSTD
jgi:hypothetical protein